MPLWLGVFVQLSMAVIIIPCHKVTVREKQQSYVYGMLGGRLVQDLPSGVISEVSKSGQ